MRCKRLRINRTQRFEEGYWHSLGVQNVAGTANVTFIVADRNSFFLLGNGGKFQLDPWFGRAQQCAGKIILMKTLHHYNDSAGLYVVEP